MKKYTLFFSISFLLLLCGCSKFESRNTPPPLQDGMYLEYSVEDDSKPYRVTFNAQQEDNWKISVKWGAIAHSAQIDKEGFGSRPRSGRSYIKFWLPPQYRKLETPVNIMVPNKMELKAKVIEQKQWRKWHVYVVKLEGYTDHSLRFYEANSGWLVGQENYDSLWDYHTMHLTNSNVNIPTK